MTYFNELKQTMEWLAEQPNTLFIGQAVLYPGTGMSDSLVDIPNHLKYELIVDEEMQAGISLGLGLSGKIPISVFPRWNFLLCAVSQIVNHLDKYTLISDGGYKPKVIIRTAIGSIVPLDPQEQHRADFTDAFKLMCKTINVIRLDNKEDIFQEYKKAYERNDGISTILCEIPDKYNEG